MKIPSSTSNETSPAKWPTRSQIAGGAAAVAAFSIGAFVALRFKVAGPSEYIVRTGWRIKDVAISKTALQLPFQTAKKFSIAPSTFHVEVDAMSAQRIPFRMPSVWTIGPKDDEESLEKYAKLLMDKGSNGIKETVEGVIQGETRVLTANLDLNQLFAEREDFKKGVVEKTNTVLNPFGLLVYNSNIAELKDLDEKNRYFEEQKQRSLQEVNQQARVAVAEAIKSGDIGEKKHQGEARKTKAGIESDATIEENNKNKDIAESRKNLAVAEASYTQEIDIANAQAQANAQKKTFELQKDVEKVRQEQETEKRRASELSAANVTREVAIQRAEGEAKAIEIKASADLFAKQKEAEGNLAIANAQATGLQNLIASAGNMEALNRYLLIERDILPKLAEQQAAALKNMKPRISYWQTGNSSSPLSANLTDLFKTGMPLFDGIKQQTGYDFLGSIGVKKEEKKGPDLAEAVKLSS